MGDDVTQPGDGGEVQAPHERLALAHHERVDRRLHPGCPAGPRDERPRGRPEERDADDDEVTAPERDARDEHEQPDEQGPAERSGGAPPAGHAVRAVVRGVRTVRRTSATTVAEVTSPIHSSGRTTTRCSRTAGATALTSSGAT